MTGYCNGCGKCCEAIRITQSPEDLQAAARRRSSNFEFVARHWHAMSEYAAFVISPVLRLQKEAGVLHSQAHHYYSCDMYDPTTHECMAHDERPPVCSGYPFYGHDPHNEEVMTWYSPTCGYIADHVKRPGERALLIELAEELRKVDAG